jgi:hypothetical protein
MKNKPQPMAAMLVSPPREAMRDSVGERRSAAHLNDPAWRWQGPAGANDSRPHVAAGGAPQRIRARQTEARSADSCHVRTHRRATGE